jgi:NAD(P)-dependent dehydrogenase (short-subunit alcohol dehydrogenase family)
MSLQQEDVILVGATGAMGQAIARRLSQRGLRVLAVARRADPLVSLANQIPGLVPCVADIAADAAQDQVASQIRHPVRAVIHGPGVATAGGVLVAPTSAIVDAVNIKVGGMLRMIRAADDQLANGARLIAIGGHYGFEPSAYAATAGVANAALANLVRQLSWAYGPRHVTAHLLAPGPADTERLRRVAQERADRSGISLDACLDDMKKESAIGAFTTIEQVAWAIDCLLDPEADALAGSTLFMDAGRRRGIP